MSGIASIASVCASQRGTGRGSRFLGLGLGNLGGGGSWMGKGKEGGRGVGADCRSSLWWECMIRKVQFQTESIGSA